MIEKRSRKKVSPQFLKEFFAVTLTSVYRARIMGKKGIPSLIKIACRDGRSEIKVGSSISNGTMISVGKQLTLFFPEGSGVISPTSTYQREIASVNTVYWGGSTSQVVALFCSKARAMRCNNAENLQPCDPRWKKDTIATLRAIGKNHPFCSISTFSDLWLMPPDEWQGSNKEK